MPLPVALKASLQRLKDVKDERFVRGCGYDEAARHARCKLVRLSAAVCGIEFCYAAETAFVSPTLLRIGVPLAYMSLVWCLSPLLGICLVPLFGSLSDRCASPLGRRRPFIVGLSVSIVVGLLLVPNGSRIGELLGGDGGASPPPPLPYGNATNATAPPGTVAPAYRMHATGRRMALATSAPNNSANGDDDDDDVDVFNRTTLAGHAWGSSAHALGVFFTVVGVTMLDFSCDACQTPCRAYLLDVTPPADHATGLTTFTVLSGLGGSVGYLIGYVDWDRTWLGDSLGGHITVVFLFVLIMYVVCATLTVTAAKEVQLGALSVVATADHRRRRRKTRKRAESYERFENESSDDDDDDDDRRKTLDGACTDYGTSQPTIAMTTLPNEEHASPDGSTTPVTERASLGTYLSSIVHLPRSMRILCLTNLLSWMSLVAYSLFFTDYVGQAVYGGDPFAPEGSDARAQYERGVRMGSLAMSLYSFTCCLYSCVLSRVINKFGKPSSTYSATQIQRCRVFK